MDHIRRLRGQMTRWIDGGLHRRITGPVRGVAARIRRRRAAAADGSWVMTCPCGTTVSVWDLGGRRYRVSRKGLSRSVECPSCREQFVGRVHRVSV